MQMRVNVEIAKQSVGGADGNRRVKGGGLSIHTYVCICLSPVWSK